MTAVAAAAPARVRTKSGRRGMKLASDALGDVREGRLFSPYDVDCVLDYFDGRWPPPRGGDMEVCAPEATAPLQDIALSRVMPVLLE